MKILQAFLKGWLLVVRFPLFAILKYGLTLIFAYVLLTPYFGAFKQFTANRTAAEEQAQNPSLGFLAEFTENIGEELAGLNESSMLMFLLFIFANLLLSAGILTSYANHLRGDRIAFWSGVRRNFLPLGLLFIGFFLLVTGSSGFWYLFSSTVLGSYPPVWMEIVSIMVTCWLLWFTWLLYDVSRVIICADADASKGKSRQLALMFTKPFTSVFRALLFVFTKPSLWIISIIFLLIQAFWLFGIHKEWFSFGGFGVLIVGQLVVFARTITHMGLLGAESFLWVTYQDKKLNKAALSHSYDPPPTEPEEPSSPETEGGIDWTSGADSPEESVSHEPIDPLDDEDAQYLEASRGSSTPKQSDEEDQGSGNLAT